MGNLIVPCQEFVSLMEENVLILDRLADKLRMDPSRLSGYPRQQMMGLVRLWLGGRAKLKDIARREHTSAPNLCASFRKLEQDGLILRVIDDQDRRNTWYSVTPRGAVVAARVMENFRMGMGNMFADLSQDDELALTDALKTVNRILKKME